MWSSWLSLGELLGAPPVAPTAPTAAAPEPDELIIVDTQDIQRRLSELARFGCPVRLLVPAEDGERHGRLNLNAEQSLTLTPSGDSAAALPLGQVNVTACSRDGLLTFTLQIRERGRVLPCDWPRELLRMQSRRHFRLAAKGDPSHPAHLSLAGHSLAPRLLDLSESGLGLQSPLNPAEIEQSYELARLNLGALTLPVPMLHIVHVRPMAEGQGSLLGAELLGLSPEDQREYRRWLLQAQSALARRLQVGAASTLSKR